MSAEKGRGPVVQPGAASGGASQCTPGCALCAGDGGAVLWRGPALRVVAAAEADYPGLLRVIWNAHVVEMSDLDEAQGAYLMRTVLAVEAVLRRVMAPDKVNLASLGNQVSHLHWHVIPRYRDDAHFPGAIWAPPVREASAAALERRRACAQSLADALAPVLEAERIA